MNQEDFNKWWNSDGLVEDNPYERDTPAFWAWEGWQAGAAAEREACAKVAENRILNKANCTAEQMYELQKKSIAAAIRERGLTKLNKAAEDNGEPL